MEAALGVPDSLMCIANHLPTLEASWLAGLIVAWGTRELVERLGLLWGFSFISEGLAELSKGAGGRTDGCKRLLCAAFHVFTLCLFPSMHRSCLTGSTARLSCCNPTHTLQPFNRACQWERIITPSNLLRMMGPRKSLQQQSVSCASLLPPGVQFNSTAMIEISV